MSRLALICLILTTILSACGGLGGEPDIVATFAPPPVVRNSTVSNDWQPDIASGQQIFADNCTDCHGLNGDGQGELVLAGSVSAPVDMTDLALTRSKSPLEWFMIISEGKIENLMPPWQTALSEQERWDVAMYSYSLAYDVDLLALGEQLWMDQCGDCELPMAIPPVYSDWDYGSTLNRERFADAQELEEIAAVVAYVRMQSLHSAARPTENIERAIPVGEISGRVHHGSRGGVIPPETVVQLQFGSADLGFSIAETSIDAVGSFVFEGIPLTTDISYVVRVIYDGRVFSRLLPAGDYAPTITIYDLTNDPAVISVAAIDLFLNPLLLEPHGPGLHVTQIIRYRNESDRIFTSGRGFDDGREASLLVQFPIGAKIMRDAASGRYVLIENLERVPDSLIDTLPVAPGEEHEIMVEYFLPTVDSLKFEQAFNTRVDADITVMLPWTLTIESAEFDETREDGDSDNIRVYSSRLTPERDPWLRFEVAGNPYGTSSDDNTVITSEALLATLLALGASATALLGGFTLWRRRAPGPAQAMDSLAKQIAQLDDQHERGQMNHDLYHHRRRELKTRLAELMSQQRDA